MTQSLSWPCPRKGEHEEKSVASFTHEQIFICSQTLSQTLNQTQLDETAHEQIIICEQLFAGHVVGSWSMKMKKTCIK